MRSIMTRLACGLVPAILSVAGTCSPAAAQPTGTPVYTTNVTDAVTGANQFASGGFRFWTVTPGADSYQSDIYERPTAQGFQPVAGRYAVNEYLAYIDIESASFGFDDRFVYARINLVGRDKRTQDGVNTVEGLQGRYGFRFGTDPDGRNSYYIIADQPESASVLNTRWTLAKTEGFRDTDRDVGGRGGPIHGQPGPSGLSVTKTDNILEEAGLNGYDQQFISTDGLLVNGQRPVLWQRVSPADNTVVEIALDYVRAGIPRATLESIAYLHFEAQTGDLADPQFGLWNDQFTGIEAGSPNRGVGTDNEFGTQGLGAISGVDTVRATFAAPPPPPPPAGSGACCAAGFCQVVTATQCAALGGAVYRGDNTVCGPVTCCAADFDTSGALSIDDIFAFLNAWFAVSPRADFNADGALSVDDIFAFISVFFAGC
jgi:hypothetical protein